MSDLNLGSGEVILGIAGLVILVSVVLHGVTATPLTSFYESRLTEAALKLKSA